MGRRTAAAVILALAVNAGVLTALPLLGGALETALPSPVRFDVRDIHVVDLRDRKPVPVAARTLPEKESATVPEPRPESPHPESPPEKPRPELGEMMEGLLEDIEFDLDPGAFLPRADLALPGPAGQGAGGKTDGSETAPEGDIMSLDEVDRLPVRVNHVQPAYPGWALEQGIEGEVTLSFVIYANGTTGEIRVEQGSGYRDFDAAAADAASQWRFAPALAGQKAVAVRALQRIRFSLR